MKNLTKTQSDLYSSIERLLKEKPSVTCAEVRESDYGYKAIRFSTVNALVKSGLISVKCFVDTVEVLKTYNFGRDYHSVVCLERSFEFFLPEPNKKAELKRYFDRPQREIEIDIVEERNKKYYVYR